MFNIFMFAYFRPNVIRRQWSVGSKDCKNCNLELPTWQPAMSLADHLSLMGSQFRPTLTVPDAP